MTSGYGFHGTEGRCHQLWLKFSTCSSQADTYMPKECELLREDYFECLHHGKEKERARRVQEEFRKHGKKIPSLPEDNAAGGESPPPAPPAASHDAPHDSGSKGGH